MATVSLNIHGILQLDIESKRLTPLLHRLVATFGVHENREATRIELHLSSAPRDLKDKHLQEGCYKGIRWTLTQPVEKGSESYGFYCPAFADFLFMRTFLLPALKAKIVHLGGAMLIGSAFELHGKNYFCVGAPGTGKTRLLMQALTIGAKLIGDDELMILPSGKVASAFGELQLRWESAKLLPASCNLSQWQKIQLLIYHLLSLVTLRKINFALVCPVESLGLAVHATSMSQKENVIVLCNRSASLIVSDITEFTSFIEEYERNYVRTFSPAFADKNIEGQISAHFVSLMPNLTVLSAPKDIDLQELLRCGKEADLIKSQRGVR